ncbi:ATP-dependent Clp protease ATP-binding subunit [Aerococcus urinaehominis]|uniref:ATP-dependent Clp protease ATP-binding subunit n=1 Tax=Aerococcus urinaehominis TaxID=128944 RepID=A0A0X8FMJ6_9LACT|nr:ATP-dependent Clp protease ATP-binding subunit [Aerococcus urinaehominis]AMC00064.1 ATP-dependent Clp protease ATP-binding subunit [Aerococcus urinaehominis]
MKCQRCGQREAAVHMYANVNGKRQSLNLCPDCYSEMTGSSSNHFNQQNNQGFGLNDLDQIFRQLQQRQMPAGNNPANSKEPAKGRGGNGQDGQGILAQFGVNITDLARQGQIDPIIGRDEEITRVIEILNRRTKNNPVLIGEPGVGKTAVVEGLAQKIVEKAVPQKLLNKEVIRLDVVSLVQGTGVRGQFEEKMQQLLDEVRSDQRIILFIDEIHEIVGAGSAEGSLDAGNILKPALARGELQLVGATTLNEFRQIEKDGALARRLQPVMVEEPSVEEALEIIKGIVPKYQDYHNVKYTDQAIEATVKLSDRYITDRQLPDKAIDLLDEAGSKKNLTIPFVDAESLDEQINQLEKLKQMATEAEDYEKAAYYRDQLNKYQEMRANNQGLAETTPTVDLADIEAIIESKTNIPIGDLQGSEQDQLLNLDKDLKAKVVGQDQAVEAIAKAIRRNRVGFNRKSRPIGSFLFIGPTGVGKTELARQLAQNMFGSKDAMIRFDMSEYMEKHAVSKLIGAPPGYIGYEEAGRLTEAVRRKPYALVLLDEIEKAHPDVLNIFLQIMEDGHITDAQGRRVSFKDTIIIMTSNAGSGGVEANVGFAASSSNNQHTILDKLGDYFKPEFLNRFDAIVEFQPLGKKELIVIVDLLLDQMNDMLAGQDIKVQVDDQAKEKLVEIGYDPKLGARPLRRVIQDQIEDQVADAYLNNPQMHNISFGLNDQGEIMVTDIDHNKDTNNTEEH